MPVPTPAGAGIVLATSKTAKRATYSPQAQQANNQPAGECVITHADAYQTSR